MQKTRLSLNAVHLFTIVARTGSLTVAGEEIGVTSSAISHRIKKLEDQLGVSFFTRSNNSIALTDAGKRFFEEVAPAVALIERSADALRRDENEVGVHASTSLAVRWLIPSLDRFRAAYPNARVRIETGLAAGSQIGPTADIAIRYFRAGEQTGDWDILAPDVSRVVVAPGLLKTTEGAAILPKVPAIQCTRDNWDWRLWCANTGVPFECMTFTHEFDTDDAALHACVAGLGMMLGPPLLTRRQITAGALVELSTFSPVELGSYRFVRRSDRRAVRQFCRWICQEAQKVA
ncbi:LysR family transcriptional regulator [Kumtagia ephedrae]|uniref:Transcriptional regulator n=1 Tax=Kumtagia ephedrae TaxID=2116701 RepID=A0A2P7S429_9HYPH|nr:LysR family transcriptional regulator [Mesorhizobium ephedrae]PSJ57217.1 transcriptional regulator [Mesorhizobium ephedrae]